MNIKHSNRFNSSPVIMFGPGRQHTRIMLSPLLLPHGQFRTLNFSLRFRSRSIKLPMNSANFAKKQFANSIFKAGFSNQSAMWRTMGKREEDFPGQEFPSARFRVNHVSRREVEEKGSGGEERKLVPCFSSLIRRESRDRRRRRRRSVVARRT